MQYINAFTCSSCFFFANPDAVRNRWNRRIHFGQSEGDAKLNGPGGAIWKVAAAIFGSRPFFFSLLTSFSPTPFPTGEYLTTQQDEKQTTLAGKAERRRLN